MKIVRGNTAKVFLSISRDGEMVEDLSEVKDLRVFYQIGVARKFSAEYSADGHVIAFEIPAENQACSTVKVEAVWKNLAGNDFRVCLENCFSFVESNNRADYSRPDVADVRVVNLSASTQAIIGNDGLSAYEIAVINGFAGSETEWLSSLKGHSGEKGDRGEKGDPGDDYVLSPQDKTEIATQASKLIVVPVLLVTVTGTATAPLYSFTASNFTQVIGAIDSGAVPSIKVTDNRTVANKPIDLTGIYPAIWNPILQQIESRDLARGFYVESGVAKNRGAVSHMTEKYINTATLDTGEKTFIFNSITGFYEKVGTFLTDITEKEMETMYRYVISSPTLMYEESIFNYARTNFPILTMYAAQAVVNNKFIYRNPPSVVDLRVINMIGGNKGTAIIKMASGVFVLSYNGKDCPKIVLGIIDCSLVSNLVISSVGNQAVNFTDAKFSNIKVNCSFSTAPNVSKETIVYLLKNRANAVNSTITVTLNSTTYAWASADSEIQSLLTETTTQGNVILATV